MTRVVVNFCNDKSVVLGGVELFNLELESRLVSRGYMIYRARCNSKNVLINTFNRVLKTCSFLLKTGVGRRSRVIIQHGNFLDVLAGFSISVLTFRRIELISHIGTTWNHAKNPFLNLFTRFLFALCLKKLWIIAEQQRSIFTGLECKKIHTLIHSSFSYAKNVAERRCGESPYILFIGRVTRNKGVIDLMSLISDIPKPYQIWIVGNSDADVTEYYENLSAEDQKRIRLVGPVYEIDQKVAIIDRCSFMVYPSYEDAFPLSVIEGYARGKLVICSDISETINFVSYEQLLVEPGDRSGLLDSIKFAIEMPDDAEKVMMRHMKNKALSYAGDAILDDMGFEFRADEDG